MVLFVFSGKMVSIEINEEMCGINLMEESLITHLIAIRDVTIYYLMNENH